MQKASIDYEGYKIAYVIIGSGDKYLFGFHGYGQGGELFNLLADSLGKRYTIISFDLFHHGDSKLPANQKPDAALDPLLFKGAMEEIASRLSIGSFGLLGYSMGGRICLYMAPLFGNRVTELYLFAPDGIKRSNGYAFGTYTLLGKLLFKLMVSAGGIMVAMLSLGNLLGIVNKKAYQFFISQVNSKQKRERLYNTWQTYRRFKPNLDDVVELLNNGNLILHLFTGKYDRVLPPWTVKRLLKKLTVEQTNHRLESGHDLVNPKTSAYLQGYLGV